jgi:hypothetical protein
VCFLLKRVAFADEPPSLLFLDENGNWVAHAKDESDAEVADRDNGLAWTLGYLTDHFPDTEDALRDGSSRRGLFRRRRRNVWWEWRDGRYVRR